jgi:hypothetical protein
VRRRGPLLLNFDDAIWLNLIVVAKKLAALGQKAVGNFGRGRLPASSGPDPRPSCSLRRRRVVDDHRLRGRESI